MENLQLSLKRKWFEMTKAGIKTEDYREVNIYWSKRLTKSLSDPLLFNTKNYLNFLHSDADAYNYMTSNSAIFGFKNYDSNTMTLGYPKSGDTERILKLVHKGIEIRTGNPEWGAEPDKLYFVIKHGSLAE